MNFLHPGRTQVGCLGARPASRIPFRSPFLWCLAYLVGASVSGEALAVTPVQLENAKPGHSGWRLTRPAVNGEIEGYASLTSVNRGQAIDLFVNTTNSSYTLEVFRMGYYEGVGARSVIPPVTRTGVAQPGARLDAATGMIECDWTDPYRISVPDTAGDPTDWCSGVYLVKLIGGSDGKQSFIHFVVRDDARASEHLFQCSVTTYQAYNNWGGKSLYGFNSSNGQPAIKVSFNRPYGLPPRALASFGVGAGEFLYNFGTGIPAAWEYNFVRWAEGEGLDLTYCSNIDVHENASLLRLHRSFLSVGHDEYWSKEMRDGVESARDHGVSLAFFSANTCYWQVRFEPSPNSLAKDRSMVCYKHAITDPIAKTVDSARTTTLWRNTPVNRSEASLMGVEFTYTSVDADWVVENPAHWIFENTGVVKGTRIPGVVGYEVDRVTPNSPTNLLKLATSPFTTRPAPDGSTHSVTDATLYTVPSGAVVFAGGTIQWSWGLDDYNSPATRLGWQNPILRKITRNLLERFAGRSGGRATFVRKDDATSGSWISRYGGVGRVIPGGDSELPATVPSISTDGTVQVLATTTVDVRALLKPSGSGRAASWWSNPDQFTLDLTLPASKPMPVALYFADWNGENRSQSVEVIDPSDGHILDSRALTGFFAGQYLVWSLSGPVRFRFTRLGGGTAVLNGLFLGGGADAVFTGADTETQGDWVGSYGEDGAWISDNQRQIPSYAQVYMPSAGTLQWNLGADTVRGLERVGNSARSSSAWFSWSADIDLTDGQFHRIGLYLLDGDRQGRVEEVSVYDALDNSLLDARRVADFGDGVYLTWNLRGRVRLRAQVSNGINSVVSGIFFQPPNQLPVMQMVFPTNGMVLTNTAALTLVANGSDPDGTIGRVEFLDGDRVVGSTTTGPPYRVLWSDIPLGVHNISASAIDTRRGVGVSPPVTVRFDPPLGYRSPGVELTTPAAGLVVTNPTSLILTAQLTPGTESVRSVGFLDGTSRIASVSKPPYSFLWANPSAGSHLFSARALDRFGEGPPSIDVPVTVIAGRGSAHFVRNDTTTQGRWLGLYGGEGYLLPQFATNIPAYVSFQLQGASVSSWVPPQNRPTALERPTGTGVLSSAWSSSTNFTLRLNFLDASSHRLALYALDPSGAGGRTDVVLKDAVSGTILDTRSMTNLLDGQYMVWRVDGQVVLQFSQISGGQGFLCGLFFDLTNLPSTLRLLSPAPGAITEAPTPVDLNLNVVDDYGLIRAATFKADGNFLGSSTQGPPFRFFWSNAPAGDHIVQGVVTNSLGVVASTPEVPITVEPLAAQASFVRFDAATQGSWTDVYGSQGYLVVLDRTNFPSSVRLSASGQTAFEWGPASSTRALIRASGPGRIAAAWTAPSSMTLDLRLGDGDVHQVALYLLDWDTLIRTETVDIINPATGAILESRLVTDYHDGKYLVLNIRGRVWIRFRGSNVVLSGLFIDPLSTLQGVVAPPDFSMFENTVSTELPFSIRAGSNVLSGIRVTASTSNPELIPSANLRLGGEGTNRTIQLAPLSDRSGLLRVFLSAEIAGARLTNSFRVFVLPVNHSPTPQNQGVAASSHRDWRVSSSPASPLTPQEIAEIAIDPFGNVLVSGAASNPPNGFDLLTSKLLGSGTLFWSDLYDGDFHRDDRAEALAIDSEGNSFVAATSTNASNGDDILVLKYGPDRRVLWAARYDSPFHLDDVATGLAVGTDGSVLVTGYSRGLASRYDFITLKYRGDGEELWMARYNSPERVDGLASGLVVNDRGEVIVAGRLAGSGTQVATVKYSPFGDELWDAHYGSPREDIIPAALSLDSQGNVLVLANYKAEDALESAKIIKYSPDGVMLWEVDRTGESGRGFRAKSLRVDSANNVYVLGTSFRGVGSEQLALLKLAPSGHQSWFYQGMDPDWADEAAALQISSSGLVYLLGNSVSVFGNQRVLVWCISSAGEPLWQDTLEDAEGLIGYVARSLVIDGRGHLFAGIETSDSDGLVEGQVVRYSENVSRPAVVIFKDQQALIQLSGQDVDGDALTYQITTPPGSGSISGNPPRLIYTPLPGYSGSDEIRFVVKDAQLTSTPGYVRILVYDFPQPVLSVISKDGDHPILRATGNPGLEAVLEGSDDLVSWEVVESVMFDSTQFDFLSALDNTGRSRFFRLRIPTP